MRARFLRNAPTWAIFAALVMWNVPLLAPRALPHAAAPMLGVLAIFTVALSPLATLLPLRARGRFRRSTLVLPVVVAAAWIASAFLRLGPQDPWSEHILSRLLRVLFEGSSVYAPIAVTTSVAVATDALGRQRFDSAERARRVLVAGASLAVLGAFHATNPSASWSCFSPIDPAFGAACRAVGPVGGRLSLELVAAAIVLYAAWTCASLRGVYAVALLWLSARIAAGAVELHAVTTVCAVSGTDGVPLATLARVAELLELALLLAAAAVGAWTITRVVLRAPGWARIRRGGRGVAPLVPLAVLLLSPVFAAPVETGFPQQRPEAAWEPLDIEPLRVGGAPEAPVFVPFFITRSSRYEAHLLDERGALHAISGTRHVVIDDGEVSDLATFYGTALLVDRRARLGDLLDVLPRLRRTHSVSIAFLTNQPVDALAAERWPAVEMAARTIGAVDVHLAGGPLDGCTRVSVAGTDLRRCREPDYPAFGEQLGLDPHAYVLDGSRDAPIAAIVDAARAVPGRLYFVAPGELRSGERLVVLRGGADRWPESRPMASRTAIFASLAGLGLLLVMIAAWVARDLRLVRHRRATWQRGSAERAGARFPRWLAPSDVDDWRQASGGPYRAGLTIATSSSSRLALRSLSRRLRRSARTATRRAAFWMIGLAVSLALGGLTAVALTLLWS